MEQEEFLGQLKTDNLQDIIKIMDAMDKYDFKWWLQDDIVIKSYYQLGEPILLISWDEFIEGLKILSGHEVSNQFLLCPSRYKENITPKYLKYLKENNYENI